MTNYQRWRDKRRRNAEFARIIRGKTSFQYHFERIPYPIRLLAGWAVLLLVCTLVWGGIAWLTLDFWAWAR